MDFQAIGIFSALALFAAILVYTMMNRFTAKPAPALEIKEE